MKLMQSKRLFSICLIVGIGIGALWSFTTGPSKSSEPQLPSRIFLISNEDLPVVQKKAYANDLEAIRRLIDHFERTSGHVAEATFWRERARALGDATELRLHASELFMRAMYSGVDEGEKHRILIDAKATANLSQKSEDTAATRKLIDTIQFELDQFSQGPGVSADKRTRAEQ